MDMADNPQPSQTVPQACAVPFRQRGGQLEFCIITSSRGRWVFPKGLIDKGETAEQAALKEAQEEAGLQGRIVAGPIGCYRYVKWGKTLDVTAFLMEVTLSENDWDEADVRDRCWVSAGEARKRLSSTELCDLLDVAVARLKAS